jgi:chromosome partitioning protein
MFSAEHMTLNHLQEQRMAHGQAKIITIFNEKGGSGKTTLSCQLANTLGKRGWSVLLADLDSQQTSVTWSAAGVEDNAFKATVWAGAAYGNKVINEIAKFRDKFDFIVADCAPSVDQPSTWGMLLVSDLALIPTRLSPPDLAALKAAKRLARRASEELGKGSFPVRVVANGVRKHMEEDREYLQLLRADKEFPPLEETLGDRRAYQRSMIYGSSVHAVPSSKDAVAEVEALTDRVLQLVGLGRSTLRKAVNS